MLEKVRFGGGLLWKYFVMNLVLIGIGLPRWLLMWVDLIAILVRQQRQEQGLDDDVIVCNGGMWRHV
jgi:hypothetical protein